MIRANLTDEQLIERAIRAGWEWSENSPEWPGSKEYPCTGWAERCKESGARSFHNAHKGQSKADMLRCSKQPEHFGFDHEYDCRECGSPIWLQWMAPRDAELVKHLECFGCNHWMRIVRAGPEIVVEVIRHGTQKPERHHYQCGTKTKPGPYNGFGGHRWIIEFFDGRRVETCDLWHQGTIPKHLYDKLPVNAKLIG